MSAKKLLIYLVVLAAAVGAWFYSQQILEKREAAEDKAGKIVSLSDALNVKSVELSGADYPRPVLLKRQEQQHKWEMVKPVIYTADSLVVGRLIGTVLDVKAKKTLDKPGELKDFGLEPPRARIKLTSRTGQAVEILVGNLSPTKDVFYAAPASGAPVWLLPAKERPALSRTLFDLRDKAVLDFVVADVTGAAIALGGETITLERLEKEPGQLARWGFAGGGQASTDAVDDWLFLVHGLRTLDFVDQSIDLAKMGLAPPKGRITFTNEDGGTSGLLLGGPVPGADENYVLRQKGGPVLVVKTASLGRLKTSRHQLTERRIWRLSRTNAQAVSVTRGENTLAWAKQDGMWRRTTPPGDEKTGARGSMLVWELAALKWDTILDKNQYSLENPQLVIKVKLVRPDASKSGGDPQYEMILSLGAVDKQTGLLPAKVDSDQRIFGLNPDILKSIPSGDTQAAGQGG